MQLVLAGGFIVKTRRILSFYVHPPAAPIRAGRGLDVLINSTDY
jgi:hypothetical protein